MGDPDRSGIRRDGARSARRAALSRSAPVSRRTAGAARTTPPAGRCRCRWASASSPTTTPLDGRRAREDEAARPDAGPEGQADALRARRTTDAAPFDSVPGAGSTPIRRAAAIVPPAGQDHRQRRRRSSLDPAQNNTFRAINRAWKGGAVRASSPSGRYLVTRPAGRAAERPREVARARRRADAVGAGRADAGSRASASSSRGAAAWTKAGRAGSSSSTASSTSRCIPADFKTPLDRQSRRRDPGRRCAAAGRGRGAAGAAAAAAARAVRPEYADQLIAGGSRSAFEQFVRGGGTVVCLNNASTFAIQQFKLPVQERRRRPAARGVLPARHRSSR